MPTTKIDLTGRENNKKKQDVSVLNYFKQKAKKEILPSILERAMTATKPQKPIFVKNYSKRYIL